MIDRKTSRLIMMVSSEGGIDIEEVSAKKPDLIRTETFSNLNSFSINQNLMDFLKLNKSQFKQFENIISLKDI